MICSSTLKCTTVALACFSLSVSATHIVNDVLKRQFGTPTSHFALSLTDSVLKESDNRNRNLQFDFNEICSNLAERSNFGRGICECDAENFIYACTIPTCLSEVNGCGNAWYCRNTTIGINFEKSAQFPTLEKYTFDFNFENDPNILYEGYRYEIFPETTGVGGTCEMYWIRNGQETMCTSCEVCNAEDQSLSLDCSNIQDGAISDECLEFGFIYGDNGDTFMNVCQEELDLTYTTEDFQALCEQIIRTDFASATCECDAGNYGLTCTNSVCYDDTLVCPENTLCMDFTEEWKYSETLDMRLHSAAYTFDEDNQDVDYDGFRLLMMRDPNGIDGKCEMHWSYQGVEYICSRCEVCSLVDRTASFDCSNIQDGAVTGGCVTAGFFWSTGEPFIDVCVDGEVQLPEMGPTMQPMQPNQPISPNSGSCSIGGSVLFQFLVYFFLLR